MDISNVFRRLVKATKNFLLIPDDPPQPSVQATRSLDDLNTDIILEIFGFYVSSQTDGPFILTLVSTSWRDFVLQSPVLWQWITVDEQSPDWIEKAYLSATLSGVCPLQIVLRLPMVEWKPLYPLLPRCQNLFFEIPDYMTGRDVSQETEKLFKVFNEPLGCKLHYHRAGEYLLQEVREPISVDLSTVMKLELPADGSEHPNYHDYAQTRDLRSLERGDSYHPLVLLKVYRLLDILRSASNLRTLVISHHSMDPIFSDLDLPVVNLVNLDELQITHVDYKFNGSLVPFAQSIQCPNLFTLVLSGYYNDIMDVTERLGQISSPSNLEFRFTYNYYEEPRAPSFRLPSVSHFSVQFNDSVFENTWEIQDLESKIGAAMLIANTASVLRLTLPTDWGSDELAGCVRHASNMQDCGPSRLVIKLKLPARTNLTEIDIMVATDELFSRCITSYHIVGEMFFPLLTTIVCTPHQLPPLLSQHPMPMLNTIKLHLQEELYDIVLEEQRYFNEEITDWITRHLDSDLPLKIHTLGLSWFPDWRTLLPMLYHMAKYLGDGQNLTIELPACPHHEILRPLKLALARMDDGTNLFASYRPRTDENSGARGQSSFQSILFLMATITLMGTSMAPGCNYCCASGLQCNRDSLTGVGFFSRCSRHSTTDLVSITKDTVVEVDEE